VLQGGGGQNVPLKKSGFIGKNGRLKITKLWKLKQKLKTNEKETMTEEAKKIRSEKKAP